MIAINPEARRPPKRAALDTGIEWLSQRGWAIESRVTSTAGEVEELAARAASDGLDCIVACGGDGTLHAALNGVTGTQTALALIPSGTANVWAGEARLPRDPVQALRLLEEGDRLRLDTGSAAGRSFMLMASVGLDSLIAGRVGSGLKRRLGYLPYLAHAAFALPGFTGFEAELVLDGDRISTPLVGLLAGNTRSYGGLLEIAPEARADDGLLDVCLYRGSSGGDFLKSLLLTALGRHLREDSVIYRKARSVSIETSSPWPVQLDGEVAGSTPITIECVPRSLTVVVPKGLRSPLWGSNED